MKLRDSAPGLHAGAGPSSRDPLGVDTDSAELPTTVAASVGVVGLRCAECASRVQAALLARPGVLDAEVRFASALAVVRYNPGVTDLGALLEAVCQAPSGRGGRFLAVPVKPRFDAR